MDNILLTERLEYSITHDGNSVLDTIAKDINVSPDSPEKHYNALVKVADHRTVKKTLLHPPKFAIKTMVQQ
jgi:hypothetical protein